MTSITDAQNDVNTRLPGRFRVVPGGFAYGRGGRQYWWWRWCPDSDGYLADVEAVVDGRRLWDRLDVSMASCREDYARMAAPGDLRLQAELRRDLNFFRWNVQLLLADCHLTGADLTGNGTILFVTDLDRAGERRVAAAALDAGGRVFRRRGA